MAKQKVDYDENAIKSLDALAHIRLRTGMYIGRIGDGTNPNDGIYVLLKEIVDNSIDEFIMGAGKKVEITREETRRAPTLFIGDGINDAPALVTATVGLAFGHQSEITTEAAGAVIMDTSLRRVDELFHLARRMRRIALQSAVGGMILSIAGMGIAFGGWLPPVGGAIFQEVIDLAAVLNALRTAVPGGELSDY